MREIKFRAWDKTRRQMIISTNNHYISFSGRLFWQFVFDTFDPLDMQDFELMQFTGLKDSKGVDIYEGDIVSYDFMESHSNCEVMWSEQGVRFGLRDKGDTIIYNVTAEDVAKRAEIIGNIYENPDLQ